MPLRICERCQQRYIINGMNSDFVHRCSSGNPTLDNEDILAIGDGSDYTGNFVGKGRVLWAINSANRLAGTRAEIEGEKFSGVTRRGANIQLYRSRRAETYKDLKGRQGPYG